MCLLETNANSATRSYVYYANSRLASQTDRDSRVTNFAYDNLSRLTAEQWMSGGSAIYTASYVYDAASELTSASDASSAYAYTYDAAGRVTSVDNNGTPNIPRVILTSGYDNLDRRTSLSATVAGTADFVNGYAYDALDRVTQVTQQGQTGGNTVAAKRVDLSYNAAGQFSTISRYANTAGTQLVATSTYAYNSDGQITSLSHDKGGTNLASDTWGYDNVGRLTSTSSADGSDSYTYDAAGQVTAATHSYQTNESYSYDANGNRTNTGYTTGTGNRLTSDGTYNYQYDNEGNLTRKTAISGGAYTTYTWDYRNRLTDVKNYTSADVLTQKVHYVYDVFDRLIGKQLDTNGDGTYDTTQRFVWDGNSIVLVFDGSSTLTDRILPLPLGEGRGEGGTLTDENSSNTVSWLLPDNEGTIRDVAQYNSGTDTTTIVDHLKYDAFGKITAQSNSAFQPFVAYTGQMWDADAGLYYYRARWYDPRVGRFISQDPLSFAAGDVNLYRYVGNSPTNFVDPTGLEAQGISATGYSGPVEGGWLQYGNFYANPVGPQNGMATGDYGPGVFSSLFADAQTIAMNPWAFYKGYWNGIGDTFMSGEAYDSFQGAFLKMVQYWSLGNINPANFNPQFGNSAAYSGGQTVGQVANLASSVVMVASGLQGLVSGGMALANGGGLILGGGGAITGISSVVSGGALVEVGVGTGLVAGGGIGFGSNIFYNSGGGPSGGGTSGNQPFRLTPEQMREQLEKQRDWWQNRLDKLDRDMEQIRRASQKPWEPGGRGNLPQYQTDGTQNSINEALEQLRRIEEDIKRLATAID